MNITSEEAVQKFEKKFKNIQSLKDYNTVASDSFWENFPKRSLPEGPKTKVNIANLRKLVLKNKAKLTKQQFRRGLKLIEDLVVGGDSFQRKDLPPITTVCTTQNLHLKMVKC